MSSSKQFSVKDMHVSEFIKGARWRGKRDSVPYKLTVGYLRSIATDSCPIFGIPFEWGISKMGSGNSKDNCPNLDKVVPKKGYVEGNVAFISKKANRIKHKYSLEQIEEKAKEFRQKYEDYIRIATYMRMFQDVEEKPITPVPVRNVDTGENYSPFGSFYGTRTGKDCDGSLHHSGQSQGELFDSSPKESGGSSVGTGM